MPAKRSSRSPKPSNGLLALVMLFAIVFFLTAGLVFVWKTRFLAPPKAAPLPMLPSATSSATPLTALEAASPDASVRPSPDVRPMPPGMVCGEKNAICATLGAQPMILTSPFVVTGTAVAFEQQFSWKMEDANGVLLEQGTVMTHATDTGAIGPFEIRAFILAPPETASGTLTLYEASAKDGEPVHALRIPVAFPRASMKVRIYKPEKDDLGRADCAKVVPQERTIVRTRLPIEATMLALLKSDLFAPAELVSMNLSQGVVRVELDLEPGIGGSCLVQTQRAMIENTLKQFSSVKSVVITEKGKTPEESLRP